MLVPLIFSLNSVYSHVDTKRHSGKDSEVAILDEEAILSLLETSQTFLPLSQRVVQSPILGTMRHENSTVHIQHPEAHVGPNYFFVSFVFNCCLSQVGRAFSVYVGDYYERD